MAVGRLVLPLCRSLLLTLPLQALLLLVEADLLKRCCSCIKASCCSNNCWKASAAKPPPAPAAP